MDLHSLFESWKKAVRWINEKGIPLPMVRDPKTGQGSVSLTMMFLSFNLVLIGLIGKYSKMLEGVDIAQALQLFYATSALYFGRKMTKDGNKTVLDPVDNKEDQK